MTAVEVSEANATRRAILSGLPPAASLQDQIALTLRVGDWIATYGPAIGPGGLRELAALLAPSTTPTTNRSSK